MLDSRASARDVSGQIKTRMRSGFNNRPGEKKRSKGEREKGGGLTVPRGLFRDLLYPFKLESLCTAAWCWKDGPRAKARDGRKMGGKKEAGQEIKKEKDQLVCRRIDFVCRRRPQSRGSSPVRVRHYQSGWWKGPLIFSLCSPPFPFY